MDTNKQWLDLYEELYNKVIKLQNMEKKNIDDQSDKIDILINNIKSLKSELIEQLKNQELEVDETLSVRELIKKIEDIEGGGGECPDYSSFFDYVTEFEFRGNIMKSSDGKGMSGQFPVFPKLTNIGRNAFIFSEFTGEFPLLPELTNIESQAFMNSTFTGEFPLLPKLTRIEGYTFHDSTFTGEFPLLPELTSIGNSEFRNSTFTGEFPLLPKLTRIEGYTFHDSTFTGEFPLLPELKEIGYRTFHNSVFTGEFPLLPELTSIGSNAFRNSKFDKDEDGFVKNYPGWNGTSEWKKPETYRMSMKSEDIPKLMSIIPPGAGEIQVLNEEAKLSQGIRRDKYLEENEPSDIDYYISYTEKLKMIGFKRDEYGNYVDMINDKSVIIIPEDIKFLV